MFKLIKLSALGLLLAAGAFVVMGYQAPTALAHEGEDHSEETTEAHSDEASYNYVAQPGDSYTKIARKAVQTFGAIKQVNLSQAQIIAAETFLTKEAGSPELRVGEKVNVKEAAVEAAVKKAQGLSEAQLKIWQRYVAGVNFNTDKVGQA